MATLLLFRIFRSDHNQTTCLNTKKTTNKFKINNGLHVACCVLHVVSRVLCDV